MDFAEVEKLIGEQYRGKDKLIPPNVHALHLGQDWAKANLKPIGLRIKRSNDVGDRILLEGNAAAALGAVYGGATVCGWYPITPSSSLAEAFADLLQEVPPRSGHRPGEIRDRAGRGRARLDRHGDRRCLERRARRSPRPPAPASR